MADQLLKAGYYHPEPAHDVYAFGQLLLEWLNIPRLLAHEQALQRTQTLPPAEVGLYTLHYAASLAAPTPLNISYPQVVSLLLLLPFPPLLPAACSAMTAAQHMLAGVATQGSNICGALTSMHHCSAGNQAQHDLQSRGAGRRAQVTKA